MLEKRVEPCVIWAKKKPCVITIRKMFHDKKKEIALKTLECLHPGKTKSDNNKKREREREKKRGVQWSVHVLMFSK